MANTRKQYINKIALLAQSTVKGTGLFASTMIAQAILESNNGNSSLASKYNNHFGIKADKRWKGKSVNMATGEYTPAGQFYMDSGELFRVYGTIEEGFKDRNKFLKDNPRYTKAGVFTAKTPEAQAEAFAKAGYATAPDYASVIIGLIKRNNLYQYDYDVDPNQKRVIASNLNLRSGAGTEHNVLEVLQEGDIVTVEEMKGEWTRVRINKSQCGGWVSSQYIM